jgi:hypothetical protein
VKHFSRIWATHQRRNVSSSTAVLPTMLPNVHSPGRWSKFSTCRRAGQDGRLIRLSTGAGIRQCKREGGAARCGADGAAPLVEVDLSHEIFLERRDGTTGDVLCSHASRKVVGRRAGSRCRVYSRRAVYTFAGPQGFNFGNFNACCDGPRTLSTGLPAAQVTAGRGHEPSDGLVPFPPSCGWCGQDRRASSRVSRTW